MGEPIIQLRHLTKRFGGGDGQVHALEDVSIDVGAGEIFGVIGLSGAGKSTLVRCINLLERPTDGEVIVDGKPIFSLKDEARRAQPTERTRLEQRIRELKVLRRDTQEIALVLERYYDRRYHKNDRYTF